MTWLAPGIARSAIDHHLGRPIADGRSAWAHVSLARFDPTAGGRWTGEYDLKMAQPASQPFSNYAQLSRIVALAAKAATVAGA